MSISKISHSAVVSGTTTVNVPHPSSGVAGDLLVLTIINKYPEDKPATPSGWTAPSNNQYSGGAGSSGTDSGNVQVTIFTKVATGSESGNLSVSIPGGDGSLGVMHRYRKTSANDWNVAVVGGSDNTAGTSFSVTGSSNPGIASGDVIHVGIGANTDNYTVSSISLTATGATIGDAGADFDGDRITGGGGMGGWACQAAVTAGTATAAPVYSHTFSGSTTNAPAGAVAFVRISEAAAGGNNYTLTVTSASIAVTGSSVSLLKSSKIAVDSANIAVTGSNVSLTAQRKLLVTAGSLSLAGSNVGLIASRKLTVTSTAVALSGNNVGLFASRKLSVSPAAYTFTGANVTLATSGPQHYTLPVTAASYAFTGQNVSLKANRKLPVTAASYNISGIEVAIKAARKIAVQPAVIAFNGSSVLFGLNGQVTIPVLKRTSAIQTVLSGQSKIQIKLSHPSPIQTVLTNG